MRRLSSMLRHEAGVRVVLDVVALYKVLQMEQRRPVALRHFQNGHLEDVDLQKFQRV